MAIPPNSPWTYAMSMTAIRMGSNSALLSLVWLLAHSISGNYLRAEEPNNAISKQYVEATLPLLKQFCFECHSGDRLEADLDLAHFETLDQIQRAASTWQRIDEMLSSGQMPPPEAKQPSPAEMESMQRWVRQYLTMEAKKREGDPGRVVLRRLSNAEYTYTLRDLTGIDSLDPAREFPVDGAAGEGFTNTGNALVMSPSLVTKYLDAAKGISQHLVLRHDGFRFSSATTPSDWTNEALDEIRALYANYTDKAGAEKVNLQGVVFDTNEGGRLPLERYLQVTIIHREKLRSGEARIEDIAAREGLSPKYLRILWEQLTSDEPSLLLTPLRDRWKKATPEETTELLAEVYAWQQGLFRFTTVGHIGKKGGPSAWLEPVSPLVNSLEVRHPLAAVADQAMVEATLWVGDAGDGNAHDWAQLKQLRLVSPGKTDIPLHQLNTRYRNLLAARAEMIAKIPQILKAVDHVSQLRSKPESADANVAEVAAMFEVEPRWLLAWLDYLGVGATGSVKVEGHFRDKISNASGYEFVRGWGSDATPLLLANSSDQHVRIPGNMKPRSVAVHPSPTLMTAVGWQCPVPGKYRVSAAVTHAHPECGNGVTWTIELRRGVTRQRLGTGISHGGADVAVGPFESVPMYPGDVLSLLIGPRDGNHSCDLTTVELLIEGTDESKNRWKLSEDVCDDVQSANPHADRLGNPNVWHFYTEEIKDGASLKSVIPQQSVLARWQNGKDESEKSPLVTQLQAMLSGTATEALSVDDREVRQQILGMNGPLLGSVHLADWIAQPRDRDSGNLDAAAWQQVEQQIAASGILVSEVNAKGERKELAENALLQAPSRIELRLPRELVEGYELVGTVDLSSAEGKEGSVQCWSTSMISTRENAAATGLQPSATNTVIAGGAWTDDNRKIVYATPIVVNEGSESRKRIENDFSQFRDLFPSALCYTKIVPVDEVVTLTLFYREDHHLMRLMLSEEEQKRLNSLWDELHYVSRDALTLVDAYAQLMEYATQDADPSVFEPLRKPINDRATQFRDLLLSSETVHIDELLKFAKRVYRRNVTEQEQNQLRSLYARLRSEGMDHESAVRLTFARMLVAPAFLYRLERPVSGSGQGVINSFELANRLSYFLWSSMPDEQLMAAAESGVLHDPAILKEQVARMLKDPKARRLSIQFACQWLHINEFDQLDEKSETHFPTFNSLRSDMYKESILFFTDFFQSNAPLLSVMDSDHTFLNENLAKHYGIPGIEGNQFRRVDGVKQYGRGGVLAHATTLAKQSGASRTSPILRGNWVSEVLLGERLPRPPKGVPLLPEDEAATEGKTVRQLVEMHASDPKCAVCHKKIDPLGFSLEAYDAIGRFRTKDLGDRAIDTSVKTVDGIEFDGLNGLRTYLTETRKDAFVRQFCKKLLGFSLGRSVQLSDQTLLDKMQSQVNEDGGRIHGLIETIVTSRQFNEIRGIDSTIED